jgi:hypothetical protein
VPDNQRTFDVLPQAARRRAATAAMNAAARKISPPSPAGPPIAQFHALGPSNDVPLAPIPPSGEVHVTPSHVAPGAQSESLEHNALQPFPWALQAYGAHDTEDV